MSVILHHGDSYSVLRQMIERGEKVHSCVTDAPYGLKSISKRFGKDGAAPAKHGKDGAFARQSRGFMGQQWDGTEIERDPEFWRLVFDVLLPGGYIVAFSSPRTYHHMAVAIEQAGFITHPFIGWTYASGFPKAHNAARAIDQELGLVGEMVEGTYMPTSDQAKEWFGRHYGGQVRKPALEPLYVGQKPFSERNAAANLLKHGVGAVNIDGCRVGDETGRWPANLIHDGSKEVADLFPDSASRFFETYPFEDRPVFHYPKANRQDRAGSKHPTVKPVALLRALIRHVTPPGGIVLDPFAGSGTTAQAALDEGCSVILIELQAEYVADIRRRLKLPSPRLRADVAELLGSGSASKDIDDLIGL